MSKSDAWSRVEVEAVVASYLRMWTLELAGQRYSKTAHRNELKALLRGRTDASVELKHQNISAVMRDLGWQYIAGYKPRQNYQGLLFDVVAERLAGDRALDEIALAASELPAVLPSLSSFEGFQTASPVAAAAGVRETPAPRYGRSHPTVMRDYIAREARNRSLGMAGEELVVLYERHRLRAEGRIGLSEKVEHIAATKGDGAGYDVLSFEADGSERFIEVKTTAFGKETPFYLSRNELGFSREVKRQFHLYRIFTFRQAPRMFDLVGPVDQHCLLDPVTYLASYA